MIGLNSKYVVVPLVFPVDNAGTVTSDIISLSRYNQAEIYIMTAAAFTKTSAVTLTQGVSVSSAATALAFGKYYETGMMLKYDAPSTGVAAAAGETATGAGGGICTVFEDRGGVIVGYNWNSTAFVDNELLTFSGGKTATVDGIRYNEDVMIPRVATANTFAITQVLDINKTFMIPVNSAMLTGGMDCIRLNMGDCDSPSLLAAFAILSEPRYAGTPGETAIYNV